MNEVKMTLNVEGDPLVVAQWLCGLLNKPLKEMKKSGAKTVTVFIDGKKAFVINL